MSHKIKESLPAAAEFEATREASRVGAEGAGQGRAKRLRRLFVDYLPVLDEFGDIDHIEEHFDELDRASGFYLRKVIRTSIELPDAVKTYVRTEGGAQEALLDLCRRLRREIDGGKGLKLIFDDLPDGSRLPKWKYRLAGRVREEKIGEGGIPAEMLGLVKDDAQYWRRPEWKRWFGRALQAKRDEIITRHIAATFGAASGEYPGSGRISAPDRLEGDLRRLLRTFAARYRLPEELAELIRDVECCVMRPAAGAAGGDDRHAASTRSVLFRIMERHFQDRPDILRLLGEQLTPHDSDTGMTQDGPVSCPTLATAGPAPEIRETVIHLVRGALAQFGPLEGSTYEVLADYLVGLLTGDGGNRKAAATFRAEVAFLDASGQVIVKDVIRLRHVVQDLYRKSYA
ncbi:hypothetical protein AMJ57_05685 [Parcubacteria bacterium SG8_24]|nr:MAG: hypothetical protein AMJ57_05685 [Parcubacteria bacterium SG8_24]